MIYQITTIKPKQKLLKETVTGNWVEGPPRVMKQSQWWNTLQICPCQDSNSVVVICGPTCYQLDHGGTLANRMSECFCVSYLDFGADRRCPVWSQRQLEYTQLRTSSLKALDVDGQCGVGKTNFVHLQNFQIRAFGLKKKLCMTDKLWNLVNIHTHTHTHTHTFNSYSPYI